MTTAPFIRPQLTLPNGADKLLLHSCCAPCSGEVMEAIQASGIEYTIFFYNPNIHPQKEYLIRKEENIRFAEKHGVPFVDADYDTDNWFERAKGMEWEPERRPLHHVLRYAFRAYGALCGRKWIQRHQQLAGDLPLEEYAADK